jgi:hypothetical protein
VRVEAVGGVVDHAAVAERGVPAVRAVVPLGRLGLVLPRVAVRDRAVQRRRAGAEQRQPAREDLATG